MATKLLFVRHAESTLNAGVGIETMITPEANAEVGLTELGVQQAIEVAKKIALRGPSAIYTSPYKRTRLTAAAISLATKLPVFEEVALKERNFGAMSHQEVLDRDNNPGYILHYMKTDPVSGRTHKATRHNENWKPANGESLIDIQKRAVPVVRRIIRQHRNETVVLVSHAHTIRAIEAHYRGFENVKTPRNVEIVEVEVPWLSEYRRIFSLPAPERKLRLVKG